MRQVSDGSTRPRRARGVYGPRAAHLATFGLAGVMVVLAVFAVWGSLSTYRAGSAVKQFNELSDAFEQARFAVATEESLERKYRLEPSPKVREWHREAAAALSAALDRARRLGEAADGVLIGEVLAMHAEYLRAIEHMFAAIDADDTPAANQIDEAEVDPRFDAMEERVVAAADAHHAAAVRRLDDLADVQTSVLIATPLGVRPRDGAGGPVRAHSARPAAARRGGHNQRGEGGPPQRAALPRAGAERLRRGLDLRSVPEPSPIRARPPRRPGAMRPTAWWADRWPRRCTPTTGLRSGSCWSNCRPHRGERGLPSCGCTIRATPGAMWSWS